MRLRAKSGWIFLIGWIGLMSLGADAAAAQQGDVTEAMKAERLFVRGMTKAYLDDHEAALRDYQQALTFKPNESAILSAIAASEEALDNMTMALFYAEQARQNAPENAYYHHQLAGVHQRAGDLNAAARTYETLLLGFPDDTEALRKLAALQAEMGHAAEAIATYERLIEQAGDHAQVRRQILQLYFRLGDEDGTRRSLEALTALEPANPAPYRLLGQLYLQQQKQQEALEAFEKAYEVDPTDLETTLALTDLYRQLNREADAERLSNQALNVETASVDELIARATPLFERASEDAEAAQNATNLLEKAVAMEPDNPEALQMLGALRYQAGAFADAATLLEQALAQNPRDPQQWRLAAAAYREAGQPLDALRMADDGLLLFPGQLPLMHVAGQSLLDAERYDEAQTRFEEALALAEEDNATQTTEHAEIMAALGWTFFKQGNYTDAKTWIGNALDAGLNTATVFDHYGDVHARLDDWDAARRYWRKALELAPNNQALQEKLERQQF